MNRSIEALARVQPVPPAVPASDLALATPPPGSDRPAAPGPLPAPAGRAEADGDAPASARVTDAAALFPGSALRSGELLDEDFVTAMAASGCIHEYAANSVLMEEGDRGDSIFIIIRGRVKVFSRAQGREVVHALLGAREYFGELSLDGGVRPTSVMTMTATECVVVQGWQMRQFLADHPRFAMQLVIKLIGLVRQSTAHVTSLATVDVYGRVRALLNAAAAAEGDRWRVREPMTQMQIAHRVGCSREMVCRVMAALRRGGYVAREGKSLLLLRPLPPRW